MLDLLWDVLKDTVIDTLKILPILFIAYWLMEFIEQKAGDKFKDAVRRSGRVGPLYGSLLGAFPQCGFSAGASSLYAGRVITLGTLLAVYLSTSDEMLPIFISENVPAGTILKVLGAKVLCGLLAGFATDLFIRLFRTRKHQKLEDEMDIHHVCEHDAAHEEDDGVTLAALKHTLKITVFLFVVSLLLNGLIAIVGEESLAHLLINKPILSELLAGVVGLVPNCAASVVITQLYLEGIIGAGPLMSGLLVGAGIGLVVLIREHDNPKKNAAIIGILYFWGVFFGTLIDLLHITF